jgi:DNA-binding CsgD family transcriptional regulator
VRPAAPKVRGPQPGAERLTPRETQTLALLAEGLSNKEVGVRLAISEHTAKFHVMAVLDKLGATTRTEAVVLGARLGLVVL